jgi:hypothetical protein
VDWTIVMRLSRISQETVKDGGLPDVIGPVEEATMRRHWKRPASPAA